MLDRALVCEQQWSSSLQSTCRSCHRFIRNVGWFTHVWSTSCQKRFKEIERFRGYLDLYLCFYWVTFVTQLKKPPLLKSLSSWTPDEQFVCIDLLAIPGSKTVFVQHMLVRGGGGGREIPFGRWGSRNFCDVCAVHHVWINYFVIDLTSAGVKNGVCWNAKPLLHYPTW